MTKELRPAWLKSKNEFGQEVNLSPITKDQDVLVTGGTNLEEEIEAIYHAIDEISLTPGPQGPQGLRGEKGAKGVVVSETEPTDPEIELWIDPQFDVSHVINLEDYYKKSEVDDKVNEVSDRLTPLENQVDELFNPLQIKSLICQPNVAELGSTLPSLAIKWSYNRNVKSQRLNGEALGHDVREKIITGLFSTNQSFKLEADGYSKTVSATTTFSVMNRVYWGVSEPAMPIEQLIRALSSELRNTKVKTFTVSCGEGQHIYYAFPSRYGDARFMVGGFEGGFEKILTLEVANHSQHTEMYSIYQSTNQNLGTTTVTVE